MIYTDQVYLHAGEMSFYTCCYNNQDDMMLIVLKIGVALIVILLF